MNIMLLKKKNKFQKNKNKCYKKEYNNSKVKMIYKKKIQLK